MKLIFANILLFASAYAAGQTLPVKQTVSLRAPDDIKIDGKTTEWDNKFQAFNKATEVFYTVSNDDYNLYFTIRVIQPRIIEKIMNAGITVIVSSSGRKNDKSDENVSVTFPLMDYSNVPRIVTEAGAKTKNIFYSSAPRSRPEEYKQDSETKSSDSLKDDATKLLALNAKTIQVKGTKEIQDEQLSVYNDKGIKVGAAFDHTGAYTYELALPLKTIGLSINNDKKFSYSIKLQSRLDVFRRGMVSRYSNIEGHEQPIDEDQDLDGTTDFWDDYVLAKK
jgi:hypothetical protein